MLVQTIVWVSCLDQNGQDLRIKKFGIIQTQLSLICQVDIHREIVNGQLDS